MRSVRLITKQGVDVQLRGNEAAHETTFRSVKDVKGTEGRALSLHTEPLCRQMRCRKVSNEMRVDWLACSKKTVMLVTRRRASAES